MLLLFINLYKAMFTGTWAPYPSIAGFWTSITSGMNTLGMFLTSIFGDVQFELLGNISETFYLNFLSLILATITSIGIVVMAVKGIKRVFSIFFAPIR